ncbi:hypothetical protein BDY24DRAFT_376838 [Mrakia frigida]|uniref:uncharacterized protein n=1 Tax=Mrakia frigida TaxID=29902 RepID=UPI003FCBF0F1
MPPRGWRQGCPPPNYVFKHKSSAARFEGMNHPGDIPLANAPKRDRGASTPWSPVKKRPRTESETPSRPGRSKTSHHKRESISQDRGVGREEQEEEGGQQWDEEEEDVEEEQPQEDEEDPEDPVWVGFREDFYEIVDQLPLELQRSFALLREIEKQVDSNTTELSTLVRHYINKRLGHAPPSLPPPSPSAITSPSAHPTVAEVEGNAVAGPSGYNGSMDIEDEEAVAAAVEPEASMEPSLPPPSPSSALPSVEHEPPLPLPAAKHDPLSQKPSLGEDELDPMDLLTSPASASNLPKSPSNRSPSVIPATPSPVKIHSQPSLTQTDSPPDPLSLSQESNPDHLGSSASILVPPAPPSALVSSTPTLLLPSTSQSQPPTQQQQKQHQLSRIANLLTLLLKAGEEKVAVAKGAYDRVDRQIRSLDSALATHEASITTEALAALAASASTSAPARKEPKEVEVEVEDEQQQEEADDADGGEYQVEDEEEPQQAEEPRSSRRTSSSVAPIRKSRGRATAGDDDFKTESEAEEEEEDGDGDWELSLGIVGGGARKPGAGRGGKKGRRGRGKGRNSKSRRKSVAEGGEIARGGVFSEKSLEGMAVDPNEPRYCYCQNVSYGQMIGCDVRSAQLRSPSSTDTTFADWLILPSFLGLQNDECPSEWFHLQCVGMDTPVVGKWFCRDCDPHRHTKKRLV